MPLLAGDLSVWEIAHRWANYDPQTPRFVLPLLVRDNARILFDAILNSEIECVTLQMNKWKPEDGQDEKPFFIRYHLDAIHDLIAGKRYDRKLMKWALIDRYDLHEWCKGHDIPLPEFWFPSGWGLHYSWTQEEARAEAVVAANEPVDAGMELRAPARTRLVAQQLAEAIWAGDPAMTIADMIRHPDLVKYANVGFYQPDTVRRWLSEVAPEAVRNKRGRPPKNPPPSR